MLLALVAACGHSDHAAKDSGASDAPAPDARMLPACANPVHGTNLSARMIGRVSPAAILATSPPADPRLFVLEQGGRIRLFENEQLVAKPVLDLTSIASKNFIVSTELGLLGLAFHPQYAQNGKLYVFYTASNPAGPTPYLDVLEQYSISATDPDTVDPTSGAILLAIADGYPNHNGGMIDFGRDGYLYIGTGDGGSGGDRDGNGQNPNALLGKILRIDIDHPAAGKPYGIPAGNPYAAGGGAPEVLLRGLRNPWRWSIDPATGDLWLGDVGQGMLEELDVLSPAEQPGANLGWNVWEGDHCYNNNPACASTAGFTFPKAEWWHANTLGQPDSGFRAIIGGSVYRGTCYPDLVGSYVFTDHYNNDLERARLAPDRTVSVIELPPPAGGSWPAGPSSIHADARGELYETGTDGYVWHLEAGP